MRHEHEHNGGEDAWATLCVALRLIFKKEASSFGEHPLFRGLQGTRANWSACRPILVAVDFEWFQVEIDRRKYLPHPTRFERLTEAGVAVLDTAKVMTVDPGRDGRGWEPYIETYSYIVQEHLKLNGPVQPKIKGRQLDFDDLEEWKPPGWRKDLERTGLRQKCRGAKLTLPLEEIVVRLRQHFEVADHTPCDASLPGSKDPVPVVPSGSASVPSQGEYVQLDEGFAPDTTHDRKWDRGRRAFTVLDRRTEPGYAMPAVPDHEMVDYDDDDDDDEDEAGPSNQQPHFPAAAPLSTTPPPPPTSASFSTTPLPGPSGNVQVEPTGPASGVWTAPLEPVNAESLSRYQTTCNHHCEWEIVRTGKSVLSHACRRCRRHFDPSLRVLRRCHNCKRTLCYQCQHQVLPQHTLERSKRRAARGGRGGGRGGGAAPRRG